MCPIQDDPKILKKMHLANDDEGESLAQEDTFNAFAKGKLPTKEAQIAKALVVLGQSWVPGKDEPGAGFQYQTGPLVGSGSLNVFMMDKTKKPDGNLSTAKSHIFNLRRVLEGSGTSITWLSENGWSHRDFNPTNHLVELSSDGQHLKRKECA